MAEAMTPRERLHQLVDELPEPEVAVAERVLEALREAQDPVARALRQAPEDDEPETAEERAAVEAARRELKEGARTYTTEELLAELGRE
jgi:hypothetical protein